MPSQQSSTLLDANKIKASKLDLEAIRSMVPAAENFEILGAPVVTLEFAVDKPVALLSIRLNEVESDGRSKRVTYDVLNLTHRNSHEFPEPLEPGKRYRIRLPLEDCAHVCKAGTRILVAVSTSHWPLYWPSPEPVTLTLYAGRSEFESPVRPSSAGGRSLKPFGPAFVPKPTSGRTVLQKVPAPTRVFEWDAATGKTDDTQRPRRGTIQD